MIKKLLLSFCALLACSWSAFADPIQDALNKKYDSKLVNVLMAGSGTPPGYYVQMKDLKFPGTDSPVIFPVNCTALNTPLRTYFCSATMPAGVGVPLSFPPAFVLTTSP